MRPTDTQLDWIQRQVLERSRLVDGRRRGPPAREIAADFRARFRKRVSSQWIAAIVRMHFAGFKREYTGRGKRRLLTWAQVRFVAERYQRDSLRDTTAALNARYGLDLKPESLRWWLSANGITTGGRRTGRFPKGTRTNVLPTGATRVSRSRKNPGQIQVKVDEVNPYTGARGRMKPLRIVVWEKAHGPVPDGHCVVHLDGDPANCRLDNLACIPRAVLARLNQMHWRDLPADAAVRRAAVATATLKQAAHSAARRRPTPSATLGVDSPAPPLRRTTASRRQRAVTVAG